MATIIAARKPYSFTHVTTDLTITIGAEFTENSGATSGITSYDIVKTSVDPNIAESLTVNLSPFASDLFTHTPQDISPSGITAPVEGAQIDLEITGNIVATQYFTGFDGWCEYTQNTLGVASTSTVKNVTTDGSSYITAKLNAIDRIVYTTDGGNTTTLNNDTLGQDVSSVFPVIPSTLTLSSNDKVITIVGKSASNDDIWTLVYNIVCYQSTYTIGFINRYGVWEFVDMVGTKKDSLEIDRVDYVRYDIGYYQNYNINGNRKFEVNTGWVDEAFKAVVEDLLLSEYVILYTGDIDTSISLAITDKSKDIQSSRIDKMINYQFNFKEAGQIIDIV